MLTGIILRCTVSAFDESRDYRSKLMLFLALALRVSPRLKVTPIGLPFCTCEKTGSSDDIDKSSPKLSVRSVLSVFLFFDYRDCGSSMLSTMLDFSWTPVICDRSRCIGDLAGAGGCSMSEPRRFSNNWPIVSSGDGCMLCYPLRLSKPRAGRTNSGTELSSELSI